MAYLPTTWTEGVTTVGPTNLNKLELGVQATAVVADAALPVPASLAAGDFPVWNGSAWVKASALTTQRINVYGTTIPKTTVSTLAGGPPSSPQDGDLWAATAVDANGTAWTFRYDSSQTTYKWIFVGGADLRTEVAASESTASGTFVDLGTVGPQLSWPRSGDYDVLYGAHVSNNTATFGSIVAPLSNSVEITNGRITSTSATAAAGLDPSRSIRATGVTLGQVVKLGYAATGNTATFSERFLAIRPVRVI